jgi:hypothetical protein
MGPAYQPTTATRERAERFLRAYEERGGAYNGAKPFCAAEKWPHEWMKALRYKWPAFRKQMDQIRGKHLAVVKPAQGTAVVAVASPEIQRRAEERYAHLSPAWKALWLETYRASVDRREACTHTGMTLEQVEAELAADEEFMAAFAAVDREHLVGLEDSLKRSGLAGRAEAQRAVLEAKMPEVYGRKVRVDKNVRFSGGIGIDVLQSSQAARPRWRELYGRTQAALPAGEDILEGELVEA